MNNPKHVENKDYGLKGCDWPPN